MEKQLSFFERYAAIIKIATIGILILLLLIPSSMIQGLIREREQNQDEVKEEISSKWGKAQTISGPIVTIPYVVNIKNVNGTIEKTTKNIHLLPENLDIVGQLDTVERHRNIYKLIAYSTSLQFKGNFSTEELKSIGVSEQDILWDQASLNMGVTDLGGITDNISVKFGSDTFNFNPGLDNKDNFYSGVSAPITMAPSITKDFSFVLNIKGSESIHFLPVGKVTKVHLTSKCPNPSFDGKFIPEKHNTDNKGFDAQWKILHLNRNFPQAWRNNEQEINENGFGVSLMLDVDHYQKTMRSAKYAILFIAMTFLSFFFIEILNKKRIHPIQYILIGLVLVLFYVLLLSFSEQFGFDLAYLISSLAVVVLITVYTASVLQSRQKTLVMLGILTVLYAFIYIIIQMAEYSLLFGSVGLFLFLAAVMLASRKVDWYSIGEKVDE